MPVAYELKIKAGCDHLLEDAISPAQRDLSV
jgi:hypothetical protein